MEDTLISPVATPSSKASCSYLLLPQTRNYSKKKWYRKVKVPYFMVAISIIEILIFALMTTNYDYYYLYNSLHFDPLLIPREFWRMVTYMLVHDSWPHVLMNVTIQTVAAVTIWWQQNVPTPSSSLLPRNEYQTGWGAVGDARILIVYVLGGIGGIAGAACIQRDIIVGASGAVYAVLSSYCAHLILNLHSTKYIYWQFLSCAFVFASDIIYNIYHIYYNCTPKISWSVHIFGSLFGFLLGTIFYKSNDPSRNKHNKKVFIVSISLLIILISVLIVMNVQLAKCSLVRYDYKYLC